MFIAVLTAAAFRASFARLMLVTVDGGLGGYVWTVPLAAVLTGAAVARRPRRDLPIHDRQLDLIVGTMCLVLAVVIEGVLLPRYSLYFDLLRLDLLAMWMFVLGAAVVLFGLRPVGRFAWVWGMLVLVFPLPYYLIVIILGGGKVYAGWATLIISGVATGIATGRTFGRGMVGSLLSWAVGIAVLLIMTLQFPHANLLAFQLIPALTAITFAGGVMYLRARRGQPKRLLDRAVEPVAAAQVWRAAPLVLACGVALAFLPLPGPTMPPTLQFDALAVDQPVSAPPGWHVSAVEQYPWARRLYGRTAVLMRQHMVAEVGDPAFDKFARPRALVIDTLTVARSTAFHTYPVSVLYDMADARVSAPRDVDLGEGITGQLSSAADNDLLVTWNALSWTWRNGARSQQVWVAAVDDHDDTAPFPQPTGGLGSTLNTLVSVLFRGNSAVADLAPSFKDADLLTGFSRAVVRAQLHRGGQRS